MKYIINVHENEDPTGVRYWASVEGLDGCNLAEETTEELFVNSPGIIKDYIQDCNEAGANLPAASEFEFRVLIHA